MSTQIITQAFLIAVKEANKSVVKNRYGAVLIHRNKIVSFTHNKFKNGFTALTNSYILCG
jgi:hypothetical protein